MPDDPSAGLTVIRPSTASPTAAWVMPTEAAASPGVCAAVVTARVRGLKTEPTVPEASHRRRSKSTSSFGFSAGKGGKVTRVCDFLEATELTSEVMPEIEDPSICSGNTGQAVEADSLDFSIQ